MSPWNELVLACNLKADVPQQVIDILNYLIIPKYDHATQKFEPISVPNHHFFNPQDEWQYLLGGDTYYFPGKPYSKLTRDDQFNFYKFTVRTMIKAGDLRVAAFLHWLAPYSETQEFVGYTRCDETPDSIDLIYFEKGEVYYRSVEMYLETPTIKRHKITEKGPYSDE